MVMDQMYSFYFNCLWNDSLLIMMIHRVLCVVGAVCLFHPLIAVVGESPAEQRPELPVAVAQAGDLGAKSSTMDSEAQSDGAPVKNEPKITYPEIVYNIVLTNDGPTTLGSTATFLATVEAEDGELHDRRKSDQYFFLWTEVDNTFVKTMWSNSTCELSVPFTKPETVGFHIFEVQVFRYLTGGSFTIIGKANSTILVTETINGRLRASTNVYPQCNLTNPMCRVPTHTDILMTADIYDPSGYFSEAFMLYHWDLGNGNNFTSTVPEITYKYEAAGVYHTRINITALLSSGEQKFGWWNTTIWTLDAIKKLKIEGNTTSVKVGSQETFNITCDGSPPVEVCWTITEPTAKNPNVTNSTCETLHSDVCHTTVKYDFMSSGSYQFKVSAHNNISFALNVSTVNAHTPPVLPPKSITAITIAIVFGMCLTFFAVAVVTQHIHRNKMKHVEVANFDFQFRERSESFARFKNRIFRWKGTAEEEKPVFNKSSLMYSL